MELLAGCLPGATHEQNYFDKPCRKRMVKGPEHSSRPRFTTNRPSLADDSRSHPRHANWMSRSRLESGTRLSLNITHTAQFAVRQSNDKGEDALARSRLDGDPRGEHLAAVPRDDCSCAHVT